MGGKGGVKGGFIQLILGWGGGGGRGYGGYWGVWGGKGVRGSPLGLITHVEELINEGFH